MGGSEPFYMPDPDLFGHADAYRMYTGYAGKLEEAGFADRFPSETELRHIAIELLANRYSIEDVEAEPDLLIGDAIEEARVRLDERQQRRS